MKTRFQKYKEDVSELALLQRFLIKGIINISERERMKSLSIAIDSYRQTREYRLIMRIIGHWNTFRYSKPIVYLYNKIYQ